MPEANGKALFEDFPKEMLRLFKEVEKYVKSISKTWLDTINETTDATKGMAKDRPGSGRLGLGSVTKKEAAVGAVASAAMFAGWFTYKATPDTMDAVTQRIAADSYAGLSGISSRTAIVGANRAVGGGATSAMGPTMAAQSLFYSGYSANSKSSNTIMGQLAGMSAMSGMSNQQAAAGAGAMNGMNFLRMGVNIRDSKGNLKPMSEVINQVYSFMYRGRKITKEQAATVYNPGSKGYADISLIAGGDPNLISLIQSGIVARASAGSSKAFSSAMQSSDPNKMLNVMGVDQSSPIRANFRGSSAQAKILQSTEQGLVGGYDAAVRTNAMLTSGFADLLNAMGPVTKAFMTLKGAMQTFPNTGGVGNTASGLLGHAVNAGEGYLADKIVGKLGDKFGSHIEGKLKSAGSKGLKKIGSSILKSKAGKSIWGKLLGVGKKVLPKLAKFGLVAAEETLLGGAEVLSGGLASGLVGAAETAIIATQIAPEVSQLFGRAGGNFYGNLGTAAISGGLVPGSTLPVPAGTPITSPFGYRKANDKGESGPHYGMDLGVLSGTPVTAFADGVVTDLGTEGKLGGYVKIDHANGIQSVYGHLKAKTTTRGKKVKSGEKIAVSGGEKTDPGHGNSEHQHLHFEIRHQNRAINPLPYLNGHLVNLPKDFDANRPDGYTWDYPGSSSNTGSSSTGGSSTSNFNTNTLNSTTPSSVSSTPSSVSSSKSSSGGSKSALSNFLSNSGSTISALKGDLSALSTQDISSGIASLNGDSSATNMFGNKVAHNIGKNKSLSFTKGKIAVTPGLILGTGSSKKWAKTLLSKLGYKDTSQNMAALTTWAAWEGGHWYNPAHYNPLNTTQRYHGSTSMNKVGVQSYKTWDDGYDATIKTLKNGYYPNILKGFLKGNDAKTTLTAVSRSPWGTHIPGYGGTNSKVMNIGTLSSGKYMPTISKNNLNVSMPSSGDYMPTSVNFEPMGGASHSSANINLKMSVIIQNASVNETERLVHIVANRLKAELQKSPYSLTSLGSGL